ncbi:hypothetical protein [Cryptosporangium arvum]|nr:hypothetical protein [Cryptosporangium arvum]
MFPDRGVDLVDVLGRVRGRSADRGGDLAGGGVGAVFLLPVRLSVLPVR